MHLLNFKCAYYFKIEHCATVNLILNKNMFCESGIEVLKFSLQYSKTIYVYDPKIIICVKLYILDDV